MSTWVKTTTVLVKDTKFYKFKPKKNVINYG